MSGEREIDCKASAHAKTGGNLQSRLETQGKLIPWYSCIGRQSSGRIFSLSRDLSLFFVKPSPD